MKFQSKMQSKFAKILAISLLLIMAMVACSPAGTGGDVEPGVDSGAELAGTSWVLKEFGVEDSLTAILPNTSITIEFEYGRVSSSAGCNSYFSEATLSGNSLTLGAIGATEMACAEGMEQESEFLAALATVTSFTLADEQLTLQYEDGVLVFIPATDDESPVDADTNAETKTLFVGPELVDCVGVAPQKCMQVRESEDEEWTLFYDQIIGFEHEPGISYELRVTEAEIGNPPADGSSIEVTLVEIVGQATVSATPQPLPEPGNLPGTSWKLVEFGSNDSLTAVLPDSEVTLNFEFSQINGSAGCNSYFAEATAEDGTLAVGLIGSTLMACSEELMQQEADFLAALAETTSYSLDGNLLTLTYPNGTMIFEANEVVEAEEVVEWETAVSLLSTGDVVEIFQTHSLDVTLTLVDGRVIKTVEPAIDDIFSAIDDCGEPCSNILMATE